MLRRDADRNLLFGINALQNDFISRDALIAAMNAWALEKHRPLGDILVERNALNPDDRDLLNQLIDRHLARHGGDPAASLAAMSSIGSVADDLRQKIVDPDVHASLASIPGSGPDDPYATRTDAPPPPPKSSRFRKVRQHAAGNLGVVYIARDEELNREVALKEIKETNADHLHSQAKFLLEAEVTGGLEHPGIVPVYGLGHYDDGRPYYAMRFIRGRSLLEAIRRFHADDILKSEPGRRTLELQKLLRRFIDVCNAVAYAHSRGVLHRDLKPDNVMVGRYGETLVVDWGLAKALGRSGEPSGTVNDHADHPPEDSLQPSSQDKLEGTQGGSVVGTPAYMSPEQAAGRLDLLGFASDVYSLGATLYHLVVGCPPVEGVTLGDILANIRAGIFPRPRSLAPWIDPALEVICLKAMALRSENRYQSPKFMADDIEQWLADEPINARVLAALDEADRRAEAARRSSDLTAWPEAIAAARRAEDLISLGSGNHEFRRRVDATLKSIQDEYNYLKEYKVLMSGLSEARLSGAEVVDGHFDTIGKTTNYRNAFAEFGIDFQSLDIDEAIGRIGSNECLSQMSAFLDDWACCESDAELGKHLRSIASKIDPNPWGKKFRTTIETKDQESLLALAEEAETLTQQPHYHPLLGDLLIDSGLPVAAVALLRKAHDLNPSDLWIHVALAKAFGSIEPPFWEGCGAHCTAALALCPTSPGIHLLLGNARAKRGDMEGARAVYEQAIELQPNYAEALTNLGLLCGGKAEGVNSAVSFFRRALEIKPQLEIANIHLGLMLLFGNEDINSAVEAMTHASGLLPDSEEIHWILGTSQFKAGSYEISKHAFLRAIELNPNNSGYHYWLGEVFDKLGCDREAENAYFRALSLDPDHILAKERLLAKGKQRILLNLEK